MLRHIVLLTFRDDLPGKDRAAYLSATRSMCEGAPEVRSFSVGSNRGTGPNHHDVAVVMDFDDWAAFRAYVDGPGHAEYVNTWARRCVAKLAAIQHDL